VVIDEPFSGTNATERIAAAKSVLSALSEHSLVLATTHDIELQGELWDRFDMYHFTRIQNWMTSSTIICGEVLVLKEMRFDC
jgi:DNA mismatch repair ATPase MutS